MNAVLGFLIFSLLVAQGIVTPKQNLQVTKIAKDSSQFVTPYFILEAPSSLLFEADKSGSSLSFDVTYRRSLASFGINVIPLESVNGYNREWRDLAGYFNFIKQPLVKSRMGPYEWAYLENPPEGFIQKSFFQIHKGRFVQVSYHYPKRDQATFGAMFDKMFKSIRLK